ncbi:hypothetical protein LOZ80_16165 [Paenibacillus sp. HWE-109]|uniref:hypothetical protein n=1 Tax=Paenibacillus sp. HWE-109 TaxID=1306526 RepID=UPI001EDE7F0A|nr:hypothetical protein [Paenibacillus sp. HWE-109]UKS30384.1 hypothetical protein LOZ80_16165 [Paenibacillus sp. HWE-109]
MRVRRFYLKMGLFGLLLLFCILFGVSLASSGMDRIQGPQPSSKAGQVVSSPSPGKAADLKTSPAPTAKTKGEQPTKGQSVAAPVPTTKSVPVADHDNSLNHVGNKLGDLLQIASHHGIRLFVSLFDALLGKG